MSNLFAKTLADKELTFKLGVTLKVDVSIITPRDVLLQRKVVLDDNSLPVPDEIFLNIGLCY